MKILRELLPGIWLALICFALVIGASTLAVSEYPSAPNADTALPTQSDKIPSPVPQIPGDVASTDPIQPSVAPSIPPTLEPVLTNTLSPSLEPTLTITLLPSLAASRSPSSTPFPAPISTTGIKPAPFVQPTFLNPSSTISGGLTPITLNCPPPAGWKPYTCQALDSIESLAKTYAVNTFKIIEVNCLNHPPAIVVTTGQVIYLPPLPSTTPTP